MKLALITIALMLPAQADALKAGRHTRTLSWGGAERTYHLHIPPSYDPLKPTPVVLALHGASMNGRIMESFCGLTAKADQAGFIVVYPNGTGQVLLTWNSGPFPVELTKRRVDDVGFLAKVLDDVATVVNVDAKRVYCAGLSNGGMMAYRLASELSDRIAAIASVAGTMVCEECRPKRPVPVLHFHGTKDTLVPFGGSEKKLVKLRSVDETIKAWIKVNDCKDEAEVAELPTTKDQLKVTRKTYNSGVSGAEVILYVVEGGGHVWPGRYSPGGFLGATTYNIIANDLIWEFFQKHPMK
jgi:polyhydroxybutyrate depolymerase